MRRRYVVLSLAVVAAIGAAAPVVASGVAQPSRISGSLKRLIRKEVSRQVAKATGPEGQRGAEGQRGPGGAGGAEGPPGPPGEPGRVDTSQFYSKTESDSRYVTAESGASGYSVYSNHVVASPDGSQVAVLEFPGFEVTCSVNETSGNSVVRLYGEGKWFGETTYSTGSGVEAAGVSWKVGGGALLGTGRTGTAHYQVINGDSPTRVWTITVSVVRNWTTLGSEAGPHCFGEARGGPA
jgi:hypothetical protein